MRTGRGLINAMCIVKRGCPYGPGVLSTDKGGCTEMNDRKRKSEWYREWAEARSASRSKDGGGNLCPRQGRDTRPVRNRMMWRVRLGTPKK